MLCGLLAGMVGDLFIPREHPDITLPPAHFTMGSFAEAITPAMLCAYQGLYA